MESNLIGYLDRKRGFTTKRCCKTDLFFAAIRHRMISYDTRFSLTGIVFGLSICQCWNSLSRYRFCIKIYHLLFAFEFGGGLSFRPEYGWRSTVRAT